MKTPFTMRLVRKVPRYILSLLLFFAFGISGVEAQDAFQESATDQATMAYISKFTSNNTVASGVTFQYEIKFWMPAGVVSARVSDMISNQLEILGYTVSPFPTGNQPVVTVPPAGAFGGQVLLQWSSVTTQGFQGQINLFVRFRKGQTCDRDSVRNSACLWGETLLRGVTPHVIRLCTKDVITIASASDTWTISKNVVDGAQVPHIITNCRGDADDTVHYRIQYSKAVGVVGQYDLYGATVTDAFNANQGQFVRSVPLPSTLTSTSATWNLGDLIVDQFNAGTIDVWVVYPSNQNQVTNTASLTGRLGSPTGRCGAVQRSASACAILNLPMEKGTISKSVSTLGQPGCGGKYTIKYCNTGNVPAPIGSVVITDNLPTGLTFPALLSNVTVPSGFSFAVSGTTCTFTNTAPVPVGACRTFTIPFSIPQGASIGSVISNTANVSISGGPVTSQTNTFTIANTSPVICAYKEVCSPQVYYHPGNVIRYRLRIQNNGGAPLLGGVITENLPPDLRWVAGQNVVSYSSSQFNPACGSTTTNTLPVSVSTTGNTVTFSLPSIPGACLAFSASQCGANNIGSQFYFIEFDAAVTDSAAIGNMSNTFTVSGTNLSSTVTSNTVWVTITGLSVFELIKDVSVSGTPFSATGLTSSGSQALYRLRFVNGSSPGAVALRNVVMVDELPLNTGTTDNLILGPNTSRNSTFHQPFAFLSSAVPSASIFYDQADAANPSLSGVSSIPTISSVAHPSANLLPITGVGTPTWTTGTPPVGRKTFGLYFGSNAILPGGASTGIVAVTNASNLSPNDSACNSFVANASARYRLNGTTVQERWGVRAESNTACIGIGATDDCIDFESDVDASDWTTSNVRSSTIRKDSTRGQYISFVDGSGASYAFNNNDFGGNWLDRGMSNCLCFDYRVTWDAPSGSTAGSAPKFTIYTGPDAGNASDLANRFRAELLGNPSLPPISNGVWQRFCIPLGPCVNNEVPSSSEATWRLGGPGGLISDPDSLCNIWNSIITNVTGIALFTDYNSMPSEVVDFDNFCWRCDPACDGEEIGEVSIDSSCCEGYIPIVNRSNNSSPISQISYSVISGSVVDHVTVVGACASQATYTPAAQSGTTSGSISFPNPFCSALNFTLDVRFAASQILTVLEISVLHEDGSKCIDTLRFQCRPHVQQRCDSIRIEDGLIADHVRYSTRTVTIFNLKQPSSPICSVEISLSPAPPSGWGGDMLFVDDLSNELFWDPMIGMNTQFFDRIVLGASGTASHGLPSQTFVQFNLSVQKAFMWEGTLTIRAIHCGGDTCSITVPWCAKPDTVSCISDSSGVAGQPIPVGQPGSLIGTLVRIPGLELREGRLTRTLSFSVAPDGSTSGGTIMALYGNNNSHNSSKSNSAGVAVRGNNNGEKMAIIFNDGQELRSGDTIDVSIMMYSSKPGVESLPLIVTYRDQYGNAMGTRRIDARRVLVSVRENPDDRGRIRIQSVVPNPSTSTVEIVVSGNVLGAHLVIETASGARIYSDTLSESGSSDHRIMLNTSKYASGVYYIRLITHEGSVSTPLVITR